MIRLNCFFMATGDQFEAALEAAKSLTALSLEHEGVIAYDTFASATRSNIFMICETWESEEALEKHMATPEFKKYVAIIQSAGKLKIEQFNF